MRTFSDEWVAIVSILLAVGTVACEGKETGDDALVIGSQDAERDARDVVDGSDSEDFEVGTDTGEPDLGADDVLDGGAEADGMAMDATDGRDSTADTRPDAAGGGAEAEPWTHLLGGNTNETAWDSAVGGSGDIYVAGVTSGALGGASPIGGRDAFVAKYAASGQLEWVEIFGTERADEARGVAVGESGGAYVVGHTKGDLGETTNGGKRDVFVARFDATGERQWVDSPSSPASDLGNGIAVGESGAVYAVGETSGELAGEEHAGGADAFLAKYSADGERRWVEQFGSPEFEAAHSVAVGGGGRAYVVGGTEGDLGGESNAGKADVFVASYGPEGSRDSLDLLGSPDWDWGNSVSVSESGAVYVAGGTQGELGGETGARELDAFVAKYRSVGEREWVDLLGTRARESVADVSVDDSGAVYAVGSSDGDLGRNEENRGWDDAFVAKYDSAGSRQWVDLFGTTSDEMVRGASVGNSGYVYPVGFTKGELDGRVTGGGADAFVVSVPPDGRRDPGDGERVDDGTGRGGWPRMFGTPSEDRAYDATRGDSGNLLVTGWTSGDLGADENAGGDDLFVASYSEHGEDQWLESLGASGRDRGYAVSVADTGAVYVAGETEGPLAGESVAGESDAFVAKFDASGRRQWVELLGTGDDDRAYGVTAGPSGDVAVVGFTYGGLGDDVGSGGRDGFVAKYRADGELAWVDMQGTSKWESADDVVIDASGGVYVAGGTSGELGGKTNQGSQDIFLVKYDEQGERQWVELFGSAEYDGLEALAMGASGGLYMAGYTTGALAGGTHRGESDVFVAKYDSAGDRSWIDLLGTSKEERPSDLALGPNGDVFVAGMTKGELAGESDYGRKDAFVAAYGGTGQRKGVELVGTAYGDQADGVSVDGAGNVTIVGYSEGDLGDAANLGGKDAFVDEVSVP